MSTDIVPVAQPVAEKPVRDAQTQAFREVLGADKLDFYASFNIKTPEGSLLLFKVAQECDVDLAEQGNTQINVQHVYAAPAEKIDEKTGEAIPLTRIVLIDMNGKSYGCFSMGVRKAIHLMSMAYGMPPWERGVWVLVQNKRQKNGHNWLTLLPIIATPPVPPVPPKK